jgi:pyruvate,orthophosphate dikinase
MIRLQMDSSVFRMGSVDSAGEPQEGDGLRRRAGGSMPPALPSRARALLRQAVSGAEKGLISREEALLSIPPLLLDELLHPTIDPDFQRCVIARGLPASPGAAWGHIVFSPSEAERLAGDGLRVILVRVETSPEDIHGMHASAGILTARGGRTSHAAVVARGMGKPCVTGAGEIRVDERAGVMFAGGMELKAGAIITLDGTAGQVLEGVAPMTEPELPPDFTTILEWADDARTMGVRSNSDTPGDVAVARRLGAEGVGLCRTEHMFFDAQRIRAVREMILAETEEHRRSSLATLLSVQRGDFAEIFKIMAGLPVTIRLLDPPLHEFLPKTDEDTAEIAKALGMSPEKMRRRASELDEFNPMLGFRGCRLAIAYPEIVEMQARAIFEAAVMVERETGTAVKLEIMVPLVSMRTELDLVKLHIDATAGAVETEMGARISYQVGTMIELPRAALCAADIARTADFFSFGTNDLTQTVFGMSRDDAGTFLGAYILKGILPNDPFTSIDVEGVGELVSIAAERGRRTRPDLKLGLCGEHGGDPASIAFCQSIGLSYVSCSPYRVPIARLAAAQAALRAKQSA